MSFVPFSRKKQAKQPQASSSDSAAEAVPVAATTSIAPSTIQAIPKKDVHSITSGQVVLDLQGAVKELVENALDAGAGNIEVRFKDYGAESIEVIDNGTGIDPTNYDGVALKHHTSKLATFDDLSMVSTFGFRGEALSSLCALGKVQIITATKAEAPVGTVLELGVDGRVTDKSGKLARQRGTTVIVTNLFASLPVRRREFEKNLKREYGKAQSLLQAYALIAKGVRWSVSNTPKGGRKAVALSVVSSASENYLSANVSALFGTKVAVTLMPMDLELELPQARATIAKRPAKRRKLDSSDAAADEEEELQALEYGESESTSEADDEPAPPCIKLRGLISKPTPGCGRSSTDKLYLYLNGRPWDNVRLTRAFGEVYRSFNAGQFPMVVADFVMEGTRYDVNVSPDKRTMLVHDETAIVEGLKDQLELLFAPARGTFAIAGASGAKNSSTQSKLPFTRRAISEAGSEEEEDEQEEQDEPEVLEKSRSTPMDSQDGAIVVESSEKNSQSSAVAAAAARSSDEVEALSSSPLPSLRIPAVRKAASPPRSQAVVEDLTSDADPMDEDSRSSTPTSAQRPSHSPQQSSHSPKLSKQAAAGKEAAAVSPAKNSVASVLGLKPGSGSWLASKSSQAAASSSLPRSYITAGSSRSKVSPVRTQSGSGSAARQVTSVSPFVRQDSAALLREEHGQVGCCSHDHDAEEEEQASASETEQLDQPGASKSLPHQRSVEVVEEAAVRRPRRPIVLGKDTASLLSLDVAALSLRAKQRAQRVGEATSLQAAAKEQRSQEAHVQGAGVAARDTEQIERELSRVISKKDFLDMQVVGQFNLGFIIARRRVKASEPGSSEQDGEAAERMDDLFIVDQHASDEKYNFETLQRETVIRSQRLISPRTLELAPSDELVAASHLAALQANGFEVVVDEEAAPGSRVQLIAQPVSKSTVFGVKDLEELLHLLRDVAPGSAKTIRCTKATAMFASRACRKSVMIGKALNTRQMTNIMRHLSELEQPWNCPHGRPTLRHLVDLQSKETCAGSENVAARFAQRSVDWKAVKSL